MPTPPRRRTPAAGPTRRPRVAGLRKPTAPAPTDDTQVTPEATLTGPGSVTPPVNQDPADLPDERGSESADQPDDHADQRSAATPRPGSDDRTSPADLPDDHADQGDSPADLPEAHTEPPGAVLGQPLDVAGPARAVPAPIDPDPADHQSPVRTTGVLGADDQDDPEDIADDPVSRPTGKRRATGTPLVPEAPAPVAARATRSMDRVVVLLVFAVLFGGLALFFKGQHDSVTSQVDSGNTALVDAAATSEVTGRLTVAVERTLSYSYTDLDANAKAVKETLAGTATCEYDKLFGQVRKLAPEQKLVLTTKVRKIGVTRLDGDRADLLVFVDQSTTRADQAQTTASGAVFGVRAERLDGGWKITDFDMLDQALPGGQSTEGC
ncbi:hypothetical protein [Actinokineospora globicatena]|uniref:hypothetical protein n=1 Tax=Actinokineospora globicatena TaxID=103729 RepID=UPI0020A243C1|nr:hypothetical protein [Actinokineospora globicatena]MCP2301811.1 Mce-associated membrane protein [Actinokineospora globicatena]GLW76531.1 hypothetical protein Aglo01_10130 [Actinokineospora globicatena]GLW83365.1 hypothetical protein Aglo02_10050 [Actinokineospora globicatena]